MKKIRIHQKGVPSVELVDNNDEEHVEYCKKLSAVFQMTNVVMLNLNNSTFMVRPSQLVSIEVEDSETEQQEKIEPEEEISENEVVEKDQPVEEPVDIITDAE